MYINPAPVARVEKMESGKALWDTTIVNQDDQVVANYDVLTLVAK